MKSAIIKAVNCFLNDKVIGRFELIEGKVQWTVYPDRLMASRDYAVLYIDDDFKMHKVSGLTDSKKIYYVGNYLQMFFEAYKALNYEKILLEDIRS